VPIIRIEMLSGRTEDQKRELVDVFTREMARIAKCLAADVQVLIFEINHQNWATGGGFPDRDTQLQKDKEEVNVTII
jgi:4-oxalocrotonate tautomerase